MFPAKPTSQTGRRILMVASVLALVIGGLCLLLFTTVPMPETSPGMASTALVRKYFRPKSLEPGDWVWVELPDNPGGTNVLRRLGWIQEPDHSKMPQGRRRTAGKRVARKILEMDVKPTYFISASGADTNQLIPLPEHRIRGKAIHFF